MENNYYMGSFGNSLCNGQNVYSYDLHNMKKKHKKHKKKKAFIKKLKKFFCGIVYSFLDIAMDFAKETAMAYVKRKLVIA